VGKPAARWLGLVVLLYSVRWQLTQLFVMPTWLKLAPNHVLVLWQSWHCVEMLLAMWFGAVVAWYSARWQSTHWLGVPANTPPTWHSVQSAPACAPVRGQIPWLKPPPDQVVGMWQRSQALTQPWAR